MQRAYHQVVVFVSCAHWYAMLSNHQVVLFCLFCLQVVFDASFCVARSHSLQALPWHAFCSLCLQVRLVQLLVCWDVLEWLPCDAVHRQSAVTTRMLLLVLQVFC